MGRTRITPKRRKRVGPSSAERGRGTQNKRIQKEANDVSQVTPKQRGRKKKSSNAVPPLQAKTNVSQRIRDLTVTKKAYTKWKPLSSATKEYVKQIAESTVPAILNTFDKEAEKEQIQLHLNTLCQRVVAELKHLKGPAHKEDYNVHAHMRDLEDTLVSYNSQVDSLEKELEEQRSLLAEEEKELNENQADGVESADSDGHANADKLHPLLRIESINSLNLPSVVYEEERMRSIDETFDHDCSMSVRDARRRIPPELEENGRRLARSLAGLEEQADRLRIPQWLESVAQVAEDIARSSSRTHPKQM